MVEIVSTSPRRIAPRLRRALAIAHRWLGAVLCVLFVVWFASGMVMLFADYPELDDGERLATLPALAGGELVSAEIASAGEPVSAATLTTVRGRPAWRLETERGTGVVFADDGTAMPALDVDDAIDEVARRYRVVVDRRDVERIVEPDQWTLYASMRRRLPAWRLDVGDADGTEIYVAERTGEIVQVTTRRQRILAWLGAIPHWLYPAALVRHRGLWRDLVIALATLGLVSCGIGVVLGVWSWRFRRRGRAAAGSPFADRWMRWHHLLGLGFGAFACTWALSGALSLNPTRWSPGPYPSDEDVERLAGGRLDVRRFGAVPPACDAAREIELIRLGGVEHALCRWSPTHTRLVPAAGGAPRASLSVDEIAAAVRRGWPHAAIAAVELRTEPDAYHYPTHREPRFAPYVRVRLADADDTTLYVDPQRGALLRKHVVRSRIERWLYHGLHSLDLPWLYRHRWLWRCVVLALLAGGLALSVSGVAVTIRWVRRARARARRKETRACRNDPR